MDVKSNEFRAIETLWKTLDDSSIIRDVLFKGKYISNAIKFISERNQVTIDEARDTFLQVCDNIVGILIQNRQLHRASHVLKNAQINELFYFYDLYQMSEDEARKMTIYEHLKRLKPDLEEDEMEIEASHAFYKLLQANIHMHLKYLDTVNKTHNNFVVTVNTIYKITFGVFMKQPTPWKNELVIDIFFKSKRDPLNLKLMPLINKTFFFAYIIQTELTGFLRQWLNEQYCSMAGRTIRSTLASPSNFDEALNFLYRKWTFEPEMMNQISRREKEVIKNEFAKLGLFDARETKQVFRKLNRFFTTHTFNENYATLKSDEVTKYVVEHNLLDLLPQKFIDHTWLRKHVEDGDEKLAMRDELVLLGSLKDLLTKETTLADLARISNATCDYIEKFNKKFNRNTRELNFLQEISPPGDIHTIASANAFTRNLSVKLSTNHDDDDENLPTVEKLLELFHSINLNYISDEFLTNPPHFDDQQIAAVYGEKVTLSFIDYVERGQGVFATLVFVAEMLESSMSINRQMVLSGCEEVAKLAMERPDDAQIVTHVMTFLECFSVDTRNLRCFLRLLRMKGSEVKVSLGDSESIRNVEALEAFWRVKKVENPQRKFLDTFVAAGDWFRFILLAQYLKISLNEFITICQTRLSKILSENLIRAVSYEAPVENKRRCSFSKTRKTNEENFDAFEHGKFLDAHHDLFALLLKCDEKVERHAMKFEDFLKILAKDEEIHDQNDLIYQAFAHDWPVLAVLAGTTKLYRYKYCWLAWLILSTDFKCTEKYEDIEALATDVFVSAIKRGFVKTLDTSVIIFYPNAPIKFLTSFLRATNESNYAETDILLKTFIVRLSEADYNMTVAKTRERALPFALRCLVVHLGHNIKFMAEQERYLECLHSSEIERFDARYDFALMRKVSRILEFTNVQVEYERFNIDGVCEKLIASDHFEAAIEVAGLMGRSRDDFMLQWWRHMHRGEEQRATSFDFSRYLHYVTTYGLDMSVFVKFLTIIAGEMNECVDKYNILTFVYREKPSDELEYAIHVLYVRLRAAGVQAELKPLTSDHYEKVIKQEKSLIHECLYELKAIARIDELTISQRCLTNEREIEFLDELICKLLDLNDLIEALRVNEMFGYAPEDLRLLAYMLSVCEGISSIYDITKQERQTISNYAAMSNRFNRLALRPMRTNSFTDDSMDASSSSMELSESAIFDEPARYHENKETFQAIQGLVCKIKHGVNHGHRAVLIYRASLIRNRSFGELIKLKDPLAFLELAANAADCDQKLLVMSDIIEAMSLPDHAVAEFIAREITISIVRTRFLQFNRDTDLTASSATTSLSSLPWSQVPDDLWGFSLSRELHLILELCKGRTTLLGTKLLTFYDLFSHPSLDIPLSHPAYPDLCAQLNRSLAPQVLSLAKQNRIRAELLIVAHDCFCQECSAEGIGEILRLAKRFVAVLPRDSASLIVRLLCGIGRYREMLYCFDILVKGEAFEALLGHFSERQSSGLKQALLAYLNEFHAGNTDFYRMAATRFQMHTELAKIWRASAIEKIEKIHLDSQVKIPKSARIFTRQSVSLDVPYLKCVKNLMPALNEALDDMIRATEVLASENKIEMCQKFTNFCELIAVQMNLVKVALEIDAKLCPSLLQNERSNQVMQFFANYELSVPQTIILNKNLENLQIDYAKAIFCRCVIDGDKEYMTDFIKRLGLTDTIIESVIKLAQFEVITQQQEEVLQKLVHMVRDVGKKFRLASLLGLKTIMQMLVNDEQNYYYLLDTKYGAVDVL